MWIAKPKLHPLAKDTIATLARDGVICDPAEVLWLNTTAEQVVKKTRCDVSMFLELPVVCGNTTLYPLSIGAREWLRQRVDWFVEDGYMFQLAEAYAMANSRQPDKLHETAGRLKLTWIIMCWARSLSCSTDELSYAMNICLGGDEFVNIPSLREEKEENDGIKIKVTSDYGDILATLAHFYPGHPLSYWLWEVSENEAVAMLERTSLFLPPDQRISSDSTRFQNQVMFRLVVKRIRENHSKVTPSGVESGNDMQDGDRPDKERGHPSDNGKDKVGESEKNLSTHELSKTGNKQGSKKT